MYIQISTVSVSEDTSIYVYIVVQSKYCIIQQNVLNTLTVLQSATDEKSV